MKQIGPWNYFQDVADATLQIMQISIHVSVKICKTSAVERQSLIYNNSIY